jgi:hypothetical protein
MNIKKSKCKCGNMANNQTLAIGLTQDQICAHVASKATSIKNVANSWSCK